MISGESPTYLQKRVRRKVRAAVWAVIPYRSPQSSALDLRIRTDCGSVNNRYTPLLQAPGLRMDMQRQLTKLIRPAVACIAMVLVSNRLCAESAPNILYIFTDDQSARSVSCYEEARPWAETPHIDQPCRVRACASPPPTRDRGASRLGPVRFPVLLQHRVKTLTYTARRYAGVLRSRAVAFLPLGI